MMANMKLSEFERATMVRPNPTEQQTMISRTGEALASLSMSCEILGLSAVELQRAIDGGQLRAVRDVEQGWKIPLEELRAARDDNRFLGAARVARFG